MCSLWFHCQGRLCAHRCCVSGCSPVFVSVVVMCAWQQVMLFPEGPGPCRCPASSSYTVYTKLCMYKIEKSAKENSAHARMSEMNQQLLKPSDDVQNSQSIYNVVGTEAKHFPHCE